MTNFINMQKMITDLVCAGNNYNENITFLVGFVVWITYLLLSGMGYHKACFSEFLTMYFSIILAILSICVSTSCFSIYPPDLI